MEHVEVLRDLRDRWVRLDEKPALDAAIAALSAPQPPAEAQADEVMCAECGQPTMHIGSICYACAHPAEAQPCGCGEATCTVPWEPGCGLGKSEQHAVVEAAPPSAPVGVKRKYPDDGNGDDDAYNRGWNDCLDALAQQPAAVDEAMVERATMTLLGKSYDMAPGVDWRCDRAWTVNKVRKHMRAALTAALAAQPGGSDNG